MSTWHTESLRSTKPIKYVGSQEHSEIGAHTSADRRGPTHRVDVLHPHAGLGPGLHLPQAARPDGALAAAAGVALHEVARLLDEERRVGAHAGAPPLAVAEVPVRGPRAGGGRAGAGPCVWGSLLRREGGSTLTP